MKKLHGVHLAHHKNTENSASVPLPLPKLVRIPMSMHIGAPCTPLVKPRDTVLVGQKIGDTDAYEVTIPGTEGSARGTFVDMGNPHVVAVIEDAFASLPVVESLDLVTKPVVAPVIESDQNVEFVRVDDIDQSTGVGEATMRVNERGCGETLSCGTGLCATGIVLQAKTGISHWDITVRGGTLRVDVTDSDVKLTGAATLVADIDLL